MRCAFLIVILIIVSCAKSRTPEEWKSRIIYQVLTDRFAKSSDTTQPCDNLGNYCGGTFQGIINHIDYIKALGFNAIWISPIVENTDGGYHGYWLKDLHQVNPKFGTAADLKKLVDICHSNDIWVMVDVVANHVGPVGYTYSSINPFNSASHYHDCNGCPSGCNISNYLNQVELEHCRLAGLPDLDQSNAFVASTLYSWIANLTRSYGLDGIRIDTVPEVPASFWPKFNQVSGVYCVGEVYGVGVDYVASYTKVMDGVLSYPLYFTLRGVFQQRQSMRSIETMLHDYSTSFKNLDYLGVFIDNHDLPRFLNDQQDIQLYQNAIVYVLMSQGVPIMYYGTEQSFCGSKDPNNREPLWTKGFNTNTALFNMIKTVANHRINTKMYNYPQVQRYADDQFYAFSRGTTFVALTNGGYGEGQIIRSITYHPYTEGTKLCNIMYLADCVSVGNGSFPVYLNNGEFKVFYPSS